ncbi:MAG: InlB B-repeat-containing protein, partial [Clostridia bacterium]|nr:InlB B-repeat-containing protein [Clostridia bacterium]
MKRFVAIICVFAIMLSGAFMFTACEADEILNATYYKVTFVADGEVIDGGTFYVEAGHDVPRIPSVPAKVGYSAAWDGDGKNITAETVITAVYTPNVYSITYKDQGDEAFSGVHEGQYPMVHTYGTKTDLDTPTKAGYIFLGYYDNQNCYGAAKEYIGKTETTEDVVLYAKWADADSTVTFILNGGESATTNKGVTYGEAYGTLPTPTKTGYQFAGWFKEEGLTNVVTAETVVNVYANHNLYAKWTANAYTIVYRANGGTGEIANDNVVYSDEYTAKGISSGITRTGYTLQGWATSAGGAKVFNLGGIYNVSEIASIYDAQNMNNIELRFFAVWNPNQYTITAVANSGEIEETAGWTGTGSSATKAVTFGATYGTLPTITRSGYHLEGWYKEPGFENAVTALTEVETAGAHSIYAKWAPNTYTIAYNANTGSGSIASAAAVYGQQFTVGAIDSGIYKTGHTLIGWSRVDTGHVQLERDETYDVSTLIGPVLADDNGATLILYAVWQEHTYTIRYNANSGSGSIADQVVSYTNNYTTKGISDGISKTGYTLQGWATSAGGAVAYSKNIEYAVSALTTAYGVNDTDSAVIELFAVWQANSYVITA